MFNHYRKFVIRYWEVWRLYMLRHGIKAGVFASTVASMEAPHEGLMVSEVNWNR